MNSTLLPAASSSASTTCCSTEAAGIAARLLRQLFARPGAPRKERCTHLTLPAGSTYAVPATAGTVTIESVDGVVWVTQAGDSQDYVLSRKGQTVRGSSSDHIVLQPTTPAQVIIKSSARAGIFRQS